MRWILQILGLRCRHEYSKGLCTKWVRCIEVTGHEGNHRHTDFEISQTTTEWETGHYWECEF